MAIYLGDYIDWGMESQKVVDVLLDAPLAGFERTGAYVTGKLTCLVP